MDPETAKIIGEEIDRSLQEAWDEGYKAATLELEPKVEYWKTLATPAQVRTTDHFWSGVAWGGIPAGVLGFLAGASLVILAAGAVN